MDETLPSETTADMIAIPETPSEGLLVSMALRADHGFLTPPHTVLGMRLGLTDAERRERLDLIRRAYEAALSFGTRLPDGKVLVPKRPSAECVSALSEILGCEGGGRAPLQVYEEFALAGFWRPQSEDDYVKLLRTAERWEAAAACRRADESSCG